MRITLFIVAAALLGTASPASAQIAPPPKPIVTSIDKVPMVELYDGGGGLPYLGSTTSYNAGDWENALRTYHETSLSNYSAINADTFTFGPNSQAEAASEIGVAIPSTLTLYQEAISKGV